jgi:hypothetical protein
MPRFLHLIKRDSPPLAADIVARQHQESGSEVTVVLLDGAAPDLPAGVAVKRLGADLDHDKLLDLIFESDHVVTW